MAVAYDKGLVEVGDGVFAYLQPDGGWGWSNAGLVVGPDRSLLVDTLFDMALTREMLSTMEGVTRTSPISTIVNTHANGDHCYGNAAVGASEIIASEASAREMDEVPAAMLAGLLERAPQLGPGRRVPAAHLRVVPVRRGRAFVSDRDLHRFDGPPGRRRGRPTRRGRAGAHRRRRARGAR